MYELSETDLDRVSGGRISILNHVYSSFNTGGVTAGGNITLKVDGSNNVTQIGSNGGLNISFPLFF